MYDTIPKATLCAMTNRCTCLRKENTEAAQGEGQQGGNQMLKTKMTREEWSWVLYDVANSAYVLLVATILPILSNEMAIAEGYTANQATAAWSFAATAATLLFIVLGPILGACADNRGAKRKLFLVFFVLGVIGCAVMGFMQGWIAFLVVYVVSKIGFNGSLIFYDSMLTDITEDDRMDEVSSRGFAYGYIGSCLPFLLGLAVVLLSQSGVLPLSLPSACLIALLITAVWWSALTVPLLRTYQQRYFVQAQAQPVRESFRRLLGTLRNIGQNRAAFLFLLAFFFYIDGVYTIIEIATPYGISMGIGTTHLLLALLLTQVVAFPFAILFGRLAKKYSTRKLLETAILIYFGIALFAFQLDKTWEFWMLAAMVGGVQGGVQALSRSFFARLIPKERSNEFFGFYDIFGKSASFVGTTLMGVIITATNKPNLGVIPIAVMFVIGYLLLRAVPKQENE